MKKTLLSQGTKSDLFSCTEENDEIRFKVHSKLVEKIWIQTNSENSIKQESKLTELDLNFENWYQFNEAFAKRSLALWRFKSLQIFGIFPKNLLLSNNSRWILILNLVNSFF